MSTYCFYVVILCLLSLFVLTHSALVTCDAEVADVSILDNMCSFDYLSSKDTTCSGTAGECENGSNASPSESIVKSYAIGHLKLDLSRADVSIQSAIADYGGNQATKAPLRSYEDVSALADILYVECLASSSRAVRFNLLQSPSLCPAEQGPSFLIPSLPAHSNIPVANYLDIDDEDTSSFDILLVLSVSSTYTSKVFLDSSLISTCALKFTPTHAQEHYPPKHVTAMSTVPASIASNPARRRRPVPSVLSRISCILSPSVQLLPSSTLIVATAHSTVPAPTVFLESTASVTASTGTQAATGASSRVQWVASAVAAVMNPVLRTVEDQSAINMASSINSLLRFTLNQRVPPQVTYLITESLRRNITNVAVSGITALLVPTLEKSLSLSLSNPIADHINAWLPPMLSTKLSDLLDRSLSHHLIHDIPELLRRMLPSALTMTLTRAITHAVTPTVATTLSKSTEYGHYCYLCYYHKKACWLCGSSTESMYYNNYHATYYSDYFSDYYTPYYYAAITKLTNRNVPTVLPESMGYADKVGKDDGPGPTS